MSSAQLNLTVVVSGQPARLDGIAVSAPLHFVVARARHQTNNVGRGEVDWELRDSSGVILDLELTIEAAALTDGQLLYLQPRAGAGGTGLLPWERESRILATLQPTAVFVESLRVHSAQLLTATSTRVLLREAARRIEDAEAVIEEIEAPTPEVRDESELPLPRTVPRFEGTMEFPRRSCVDQRTPLETALWTVHSRIEAMPASPHLTDAGSLLAQAADKLADYLEGAPT
jgi:hypothetical protein